MPHRTDVTNATARTGAINTLAAVGRFSKSAAPIVAQHAVRLRSLAANMEAAVPNNGDAIRAALVLDQPGFTAAVIAQSPQIENILEYVNTTLAELKAGLDALAADQNVTVRMPQMVVDPADI